MSAPAPTLGQRALGGFGWGAVTVAASAVFQLAFTAALARLLDPTSFGVMAMALVGLRFFSYFSQLGLAAALVQKPSLSADDLRLALGLTWLVGLACAFGMALSAPVLAWFFRSAAVTPLVLALGPNLVVVGLGAIPMALLRRALRFREQALVESGSYVLGYGLVGVGAAWAGAGVWSLVAAAYGQSILGLVFAWALARPSPRIALRGDRQALVGYGARHSLVSFLEFAAASLDAAVIGRLLGEAALGLYGRALTLTYQPIERAAGVLSRVLFPLLSHVQGDRRKVGAVFLLGVSLIGTLGAAVSLGLSAAAEDAVRVVLGPRWLDAAPAVRMLSFAVPLIFMSHVAGVVCDALALLRFKLRLQAGALCLVAALMLSLVRWGVPGVAAAVVAGEAVRLAVYVVVLSGELGLERRELLRVLCGVVATGLLSWVGCASAAAAARHLGLDPLPSLGLECLAGAFALAAGILLQLRLLEGTGPARFAEAAVPGWRKLRKRLGLAEVRA